MYQDDLNQLLTELSGEYDDGVAIGAQEIIGAMEIIGAAKAKAAGLGQRMASARRVDPNAVALSNSGPGPRRVKVMPGPVQAVAAGETADIVFTSQEHFRPERFFVADALLADFRILSMKVGTEEQFVASGAAPASMFGSDAVGVGLHFKTLNPGNELVVRVINTSAGSLNFNGAFLGTAVD